MPSDEPLHPHPPAIEAQLQFGLADLYEVLRFKRMNPHWPNVQGHAGPMAFTAAGPAFTSSTGSFTAGTNSFTAFTFSTH